MLSQREKPKQDRLVLNPGESHRATTTAQTGDSSMVQQAAASGYKNVTCSCLALHRKTSMLTVLRVLMLPEVRTADPFVLSPLTV